MKINVITFLANLTVEENILIFFKQSTKQNVMTVTYGYKKS